MPLHYRGLSAVRRPSLHAVRIGFSFPPSCSRFTIKVCFAHFTSYAGLRACDAASPCRDDYICVKPMERYAPDQAQNSFQTRQRTQTESALFKELTGRMY